MKYLDLSLESPEENLACDEALLEHAEDGLGGEVLRFWESKRYFVVLGYSRKFSLETHAASCQEKQVPILRRASGGGTVLQGPGCLNYSLILRLKDSRPLGNILETNRYVLSQHQRSLEPLLKKRIHIRGVSDLTIDRLKFSGNAQRRKKSYVLFHGTFLLDFKIPLIKQFLTMPQVQPTYRRKRQHDQFLTNLNISEKRLKEALVQCWAASGKLESVPHQKIKQLVTDRYSRSDWNLKY